MACSRTLSRPGSPPHCAPAFSSLPSLQLPPPFRGSAGVLRLSQASRSRFLGKGCACVATLSSGSTQQEVQFPPRCHGDHTIHLTALPHGPALHARLRATFRTRHVERTGMPSALSIPMQLDVVSIDVPPHSLRQGCSRPTSCWGGSRCTRAGCQRWSIALTWIRCPRMGGSPRIGN